MLFLQLTNNMLFDFLPDAADHNEPPARLRSPSLAKLHEKFDESRSEAKTDNLSALSATHFEGGDGSQRSR